MTHKDRYGKNIPRRWESKPCKGCELDWLGVQGGLGELGWLEQRKEGGEQQGGADDTLFKGRVLYVTVWSLAFTLSDMGSHQCF